MKSAVINRVTPVFRLLFALLFVGLQAISPFIGELDDVQAAPVRDPQFAPLMVTVPAEMNKSFTPIAIVSGETSKLRVTVYNLNANALTEATWTDDMPDGITLAAPLTVVNTCGGTVTDIDDNALAVGGNTFKLTGGIVPAQLANGTPGSCYVEVDVTSYTPGNLINTIPAGNLTSYTVDPEDTGVPQTPVLISNTTPASATLNVIGVESPSLSKSFAPTTLWVGETSTLTVTIHNNDLDSPLTNLTLTDILPTNGNGDIFVTSPVNYSLTGCGTGAELTDESEVTDSLGVDDTTIVLKDATVEPDSDCVVAVDVTTMKQGSYTNTIPAGPAETNPVAIDTQEGVTNESPAEADVNFRSFMLTKTFGTSPIAVGDTSLVTITIVNHAPIDYTGTALEDTLPAGLEFVPGTAATTCTTGTDGATVSLLPAVGTPKVTASLENGTIPANSTCTITATARALMSAEPGTKTNTIAIGDLTTTEGATNHGSASANLVVESLSVAKDFTETEIPLGGTSLLTITISNPSPTPFTNASLDDVLPAGLEYVAGTGSTTCVSGSVSLTSTTMSLTGATIPSGSLASPGTCTVTSTVQATASEPPTEHTNTIPANEITTDEGGTNAFPASDDITVTGLAISKGFSPTVFAAGQTTTLTITLTNPATIEFTGANLSDTLPTTPNDELFFTGTPTTTCVNATDSQTVVFSGSPERTVTLTNGTIPANGSCTITATVTTAPDAPQTSDYENVISKDSLVTNEGATNSEPASATVDVATVSINKLFNGTTVVTTLAYPNAALLQITVTNPANGEGLTGLTITDSLPSGLEVAPYIGNGGTNPAPATTNCGTGVLENGAGDPLLPGDTVIELVGGTLNAAPATCTISVYVRPQITASSGTYTNTLAAGSVTTDQGPQNSNTISRNIRVNAVSVSKAFQYAGFEAGGTNLLTITLNNPTGEDYDNAAVSDTLPTSPNNNLRFTGTPSTTCGGAVSYSGTPTRTVSLTGGTIPANGTCTITALVTTDLTASGASYTNTIPTGALTTEVGSPAETGPSNTTAATAPVFVYEEEEGVTGTKAFSPSTINIFGTSRLTITFTAPPDTGLTNFSFVDNLPAELVLASPLYATTSGCGTGAALTDASNNALVAGSTSVKLSGAEFAANATCTVTVDVTTNNGTGTGKVYTNTITPDDVTNDEVRKPASDVSANLTVRTPSTLLMRKAFYPTVVSPEGLSRLTITLENEGASELVDITLTDNLPSVTGGGLVVAPVPNITSTCTDPSNITAVPGTSTFSMTNGSIPAQVNGINGLCTININVQGQSSDGTNPITVTNTIPVTGVTARIFDIPATMNAQDPATADVTIRDLDLEVVKGFDPQLVYGGADSEMSIILRNPNLSAELTGITFTDSMPVVNSTTGEAMILSDPALFDASDCGPDATLTKVDNSTFEFAGGYLAAGDECTLTLRATMTVNGNLTNTIPIHGVSSFNGAKNESATSATLTNLAGASVSKSFAPNPVAAGLGSYSILTIQIRTTATVRITGLGLIDTLPEGLQVADWSAGGVAAGDPPTNNCGAGGVVAAPLTANPADTTIQLSGGELPIGFGDCELTIPVTGRDPGDYENTIPQGGLTNNEGIVNIQSTTDTLVLTPYSLGNRVWFDTNNNGLVDAGEVGVENVRVELYREVEGSPNSFEFLKFETTDADGYYRFDDLGGGDYVIMIPDDNFRDVGATDTVASDPLAGYVSSGTSIDASGTMTDAIQTDPDNDVDNDDNGITMPTAEGALNFISSQVVTLGPDSVEPENEADPTTNPETGEAIDAQSNRTVDFGFYRQELGNLVFLDEVIDGVYDAGDDSPIAGATVRLFSSDGTEIITGADGIWGTADDGWGPDGASGGGDDGDGGMLTDASGNYLFSGLPEGDYIVKVYLPGYRSTIDTDPSNTPADVADPDTNIDHNDNGSGQDEGLVSSFPVTLTPNDVGDASNNTITNSTATTYNPTLDFGYVLPRSIGNRLWFDDGGTTGTANNGILDGNEAPVVGARVSLYEDANTDGEPDGPALRFDTTDAGGYYLFDGLFPGNYLVGVDYTNFQTGQVLDKYTSSTGAASNDTDSNDNGIDRSLPGDATASPYGILSNTIDLTAVTDSAPTGETDLSTDNISGDFSNNPTDWDGAGSLGRYGEADENSDVTIDFGFYKPMSIGNRVFYDNGAGSNLDNGVMDGDETPVAGVRVELYQDTDGTPGLDPDTDTLLYFDTTDAGGYYLFDQLLAGEYYVHIPSSNFTGSGVLRGWYNSNATFSDDVDRNDNGVTNAHPNINGVTSDLLTLSEDAEPTSETELSGDTTPVGDDYDPTAWDGPESRGRWNESDDNSNLTVDFGFIPPLSLGNRVWLDEGEIAAAPGVDLTQFNDGVMNGIEEGIGNVVLNLYYSSNDADFTDTVDGVDEADIYRTTTTDADGYYLFDGLPEGQFYVEVAASNFSSGNALAGLQSSADQIAFDDEITDLNDNGEDDSAYLTDGIASRNFVLNYEDEPTGEDASSDTTAYGSDGWGLYGEEDANSNLTLDFGFMSPHSIGNRVWRDSDNSGTINPADDTSPGIGGVTVNLYAGIDTNSDGIPDDLTILATTTTSSTAGNDGFYLFGNLPAGNYIVGIPSSNFDPAAPLYNLRSSTGAPAAAIYETPVDANPDRSDHGIDPSVAGEAVYSPIIALGDNELLNESDLPTDTTTYGENLRGVNGEPDAGSDLSVDFGFFGGTDVPFSIGNHLWYDDGAGGGTINNGIRDGAELPVAGARVELYRDGDEDGIPQTDELIRFDITDSGGFYLFDNLDPGSYFVKVAAGNFTDSFDPDDSLDGNSSGALPAAPGVLRGWYSSQSTWAEDSPSIVSADDNDNGVNADKPEVDGVFSGVVVLSRSFNEPSGESYLSADTGMVFGINPTEDDGPDSRGRFGETDVTSNLTIDFGFIPPMSIGNRVWIDDGAGIADFSGYNNGEMDGTENLNGVSGVEVELYKDGVYFYTTTTDSDGYYLFDRLQPGNYTVEITAENFAAGGPLEYYQSSTDLYQTSAPADDDEDLDDTGVDDAAYLTNGISSPVIVMDYDTESITETDLSTDTTTYGGSNVGPYPGHTNINSNLTVDFGFFRPRSLGNRVWFDTNNNGGVTTGEQPVPDGVQVSLYEDANTDGIPDGPALRYDTTVNGYYLFDNLPPRNYIVGIDAANFQTGGNLIGYFSSTATYNNATNNIDRRDNGINSNNPAGSTYGILSATINLTGETGYPTGETDLSGDTTLVDFTNNPTSWDGPGSIGRYGEANQSSDLTIDFGFYQVEIGNLVYFDANADGTYNASDSDTVLDGVLVQLYATDGAGNITTEIITGADGIWHTDDDGWGPNGVNDGGGDDGSGGILTNASGEYLFSGLPAGTYIVKVTTPTSPQQLVSTIDSFDQDDNADPDDGTDHNDNGVGIGSATKDAVYSKELTMSGGESISPAVSYNHTDGTTTDTSVDFGFTDAYALGNRVWYDTNNNGRIDGSETGVNDVTVQLYAADASGNPVGAVLETRSTISQPSGNGYYNFDYLTAGDYVVVIPASEFDSTDASASLSGYWSSATTMGANGSTTEVVANDPDDDVDSDDNGTLETTDSDPLAGAVISQAVTLGLTGNTEPTDDDDLRNPPGDDTTRPDGYSNLSVDFGFYKTEIGNLVYNDLNKNGTFDGSDAVIDGMTVRLFNSDNTVEIQVGPDGILGTADDTTGGVTTGSNGWGSGVYLFSGLPEGDYVVRAAGLANYTSTIDTSPSNTPADVTDPDTNVDNNDNGIGTDSGMVASGQLTMDAAESAANITVDNLTGTTTDSTVDFGFINAYALGNRVWFDTDNSATINGTEVGVDNVDVELYSTSDLSVRIASTTTSNGGYYLFDYLDAGEYVVVIPAAEFESGGTLEGYHSSETTMNLTTGAIEEVTAPDAGSVALDSDDNGTLNLDATNFAGAVISAPVTLGTGDSEPINETDLDGGSQGAQPDAQANMTVDFGFYKTEIGNLVWLDQVADGEYIPADDIPISGIRVELYNGVTDAFITDTTTNASGEYLFDGLPEGDYIVKAIAPTGTVSTRDDADSADNADPDTNTDDNDNGIGTSSGTAASAVVTMEAAESAANITVTDSTGITSDPTIDFGFSYAYALGNRVWFDTDNDSMLGNSEIGVGNVTVELYAASDLTTVLATDTTDANGYYLFDSLLPGSYVVAIPAEEFDSASPLGGTLEGYWSSATSIAVDGTISETAITGLTDDDQDSDDNGTLQTNGDVLSVAIVLGPAYNSEPGSELDLGPDGQGGQPDTRANMTADFGFYKTEIGNLVFGDVDKNGNYDGSDTVFSGVTVQLYAYGTDGTDGVEIPVGADGVLGTADDGTGGTQTDANGNYRFSGLPEGDYVVKVIAPTGTVSTIDSYDAADMADPNTNSDDNDNGIGELDGVVIANALTMNPGADASKPKRTITHATGTTLDNTLDFGFTTVFALGNRVWFDTNNNAVIDNGEVGVNGVTVELYADDGAGNPTGPMLDSDITAGDGTNDGYYLFDYLETGDYIVVIPAAEFGTGGTLEGYYSSSTSMLTNGTLSETRLTGNTDDDVDSNDNGLLVSGDVISVPIKLGPTAIEQTLESDLNAGSQGSQPDAQANMTVDFGFYTMTLGNLVWDDLDNSGIVTGTEAGIDGVTVELYAQNGTTLLDTVTTSGGGNYAFTGLPAGDYIVRIPAAEFEGTEELRDYVSSTGTANAYEPAPDADTDLTDDDDNGSQTGGTTGLGGYIQTAIITLSPTLEGSYDNDTGTTFEQRVDLGVYSFAQADLAITKDDGQTFYLQGGTLTYTIVVSNAGPADVTDAVVADVLPTQISSWSWVCTSSTGGASECDDVSDSSVDFSDTIDLPINSSITYTVTATIDDEATGVLTNTAIVSPPTGVTETDTTNNTADDVDDPAFLTITKDDRLTVVAPGSEITYNIDIFNGGLVDLTDITVTDTLPADVTFVSASHGGQEAGNVVTWNHEDIFISGGDLLVGAHAYISVTVQVKDVPTGSSITNNITVTDTVTKATASDDDTDAIAVENTKALIATSEGDSADQSVFIGEILTYEINIIVPDGVTMTNLQAFDVIDSGLAFDECVSISSGVFLTDLPSGFALVCATPVVTNTGHNVTFNFGNVTNSSGSEQTLTLQYWVDALDVAENVDGVGDLNNEVTWSWDAGVSTLTDSATPVEIIEPDLSIVKDASPRTAVLGSTIAFTVDIAHTDASTADAYDVVVTDILPAGLAYVDGTIAFEGLAPTTFTYDEPTTTLTITWDHFPLLETSTITFNTSFIGPSPVTNEASVEWTSIPLDPGVQSEYNEDSTERWYDPNDPTGVNNYGVSSTVTIRVPDLPETGFAPGRFTPLPIQPVEGAYTEFDSVSLEIPRLNKTMPIVGVPANNQGWDLTWLSDQAGWLEGTAYPTWAGNTALTAHAYLSDGTPGPFVNLNQLYWGDEILIHADGQIYIYEVRETRQVWPHDLSVLRHEDYDWITLITCLDYSEINNAYTYRTVVRAILVEVKSD